MTLYSEGELCTGLILIRDALFGHYIKFSLMIYISHFFFKSISKEMCAFIVHLLLKVHE